MKRKSITVYIAIISAVFAVAVIFFASNCIHEYIKGPEYTGALFDHFTAELQNTLALYSDDSPEFRETFETAEGSSDNYRSLLFTKNGETLYVYPSENDAQTQTTHSSHFIRAYSSSFTTSSGAYTLTAAMYLLRPASLFYYARFSFILILAGTIFAVVLLFYLRFSANDDKDSSSSDVMMEDLPDHFDSSSFDDPFPPEDSSAANQNISAPDDSMPVEEKILSEEPAETAAENINSFEQTVFKPIAADNDDSKSSADNEEPVSEQIQPAADIQPSDNPQGLFSPVTGFGWESYLETRLDSELIRAASSEQDIALFIIRIPGFSYTDSFSTKICSFLVEQFQFKDLLFEFHNDGFAIIRENTTIDEAMSISETILGGLTKILAAASSDKKCYIGISTRSVRILPGKRLIVEASEALDHAQQEKDSPIIAFRANTDKYRKFIDEKKAQSEK